MTKPIYAIGDIHGQLDELERVLSLIEADGGPGAHIVFLGDYVDRGPDSRGVIQTLIDGQRAGKPWTAVKGNHDRYFSRFLEDQTVFDPATRSGLYWLNSRLGGDTTLASYGVIAEDGQPLEPIHAAAINTVPDEHLRFMQDLPLMHHAGDLVFVHAGIRPGVALEHQLENDLIWIRDGFLDDPRDHGPLVVHGHTALDYPQHHGNRVNLDAGAGYGRPLCAAVFEGRTGWVLTGNGRVPIPKA